MTSAALPLPRRLRRIDWVPWLLAAALVAGTEGAAARLGLPPAARAPWRAVLLATAVLGLALRRLWRHDARGFELALFFACAPLALVAGSWLPGPARLAPLLGLCLAAPALAAWRFAPDPGPAGERAPLGAAAARGLVDFICLAGLLAPLLAAAAPPGVRYAAAAVALLVGRAAGAALQCAFRHLGAPAPALLAVALGTTLSLPFQRLH